jgi:hypothetical protein
LAFSELFAASDSSSIKLVFFVTQSSLARGRRRKVSQCQSHLDIIIYSRLCFKRNVPFGEIRCVDLFVFGFRNLRLYLQDSGRGGQDGRRLFRRRLIKEEDDRKKEAELQRRLNEKAEADEENEQGEFFISVGSFLNTGIGMGSHVVLCYLEQNLYVVASPRF